MPILLLLRNMSYVYIALSLKNPSFCQKISSNDFYGLSLCYENVAIATRDASLYNKVSDKPMKQLCLMSNFYYGHCDLPDENFRKYCLDLVNQYAHQP